MKYTTIFCQYCRLSFAIRTLTYNILLKSNTNIHCPICKMKQLQLTKENPCGTLSLNS